MIDRDEPVRGLGVDGAKVLVLGLAVTGRACARVLASAGASVLASDLSGDVQRSVVEELEEASVDVELGSHDRARDALGDVDLVVPSPGISPLRGVLAEAIDRGVEVASELDLAQRIVTAPVVAVTGTNGKTTAARLAGRIAHEAGFDAYVCGNTEVPFIEEAVMHPDADLFVVECSSFRLAFCRTFHPRVAIVTNIAPDHLDWHGTMEHYRDAKAKIAARQDASDLFLYPASDPALASLAPEPGPMRVPFGGGMPLGGTGAWVEGDDVVVVLGERTVVAAGAGGLASHGPQFAEDAAAAAAAVVFMGADAPPISAALRDFRPDAHRVEFVGSLGGVRYYDDSKATNPHAAVASVRAFEGVVLVCGGRNKGLDLTPLAAEAGRIRAVVAIGEAADEIAVAFATTGVAVERAATMPEAVTRAAALAAPGNVVLLAPACASFDAYANYGERGDDFQQACRSLGVTM